MYANKIILLKAYHSSQSTSIPESPSISSGIFLISAKIFALNSVSVILIKKMITKEKVRVFDADKTSSMSTQTEWLLFKMKAAPP